MEKSHKMNVRRMLDSMAWELREYQGEDGNVHLHEVQRITMITLKHVIFSHRISASSCFSTLE